jgi:PKD repeat protein
VNRLRIAILTAAAVALPTAALLLKAASGSPTADFSVSPPSPAVQQDVDFLDASTGSPTSWSWSFGDGATSTERSPFHSYAAPGPYVVTLVATNASGSSQKTESIFVTTSDTLRLLSSHPFSATVQARDQRTGKTGGGFALPQTDVFGFFSLPDITSDPENPEVFLKVLDGTPVNGKYWVFYGGLTDLEYTLTVTENATGQQKTYFKQAGSAEGGVDTAAFSGQASGAIVEDLFANLTRRPAAILLRGNRARAAESLSVAEVLRAEPANPAVGQSIRFEDLNNLPTSLPLHGLRWNFGDGTTSTQTSPTKTYSIPGTYNLTLFDETLQQTFSIPITVTDFDTLRLNPGDGDYFVRLVARDQRTGTFTTGNAFGYSLRYGGVSFPSLTGDPNNAEVVVKVLDGHAYNNQTWSFSGPLTDLQVGYTITQAKTGAVKYYGKESGSARGVVDISGFDPTLQPVVDSVSPTHGPRGMSITLMGSNLIGAKMKPFFETPGVPQTTGPRLVLPLENYRFHVLDSSHDPVLGKDILHVVLPFKSMPQITSPETHALVFDKDHYLAWSPVPFILEPGMGPNVPIVSSFNPPHGPPGTHVTVFGTNFGLPDTELKFSPRIRANLLSRNDTTIETDVPDGAETGSLRVLNPYGEGASLAFFIVDVLIPPLPTATPTAGPGVTLTSTPTLSPTPVAATNTPSLTPTPASPTKTPTLTPTQPAGGPVITSTDAPPVLHTGDSFDVFGNNLGGCASTWTLRGTTTGMSYSITCVLGDSSSVQLKLTPHDWTQDAAYDVCVRTQSQASTCSSFTVAVQ